MEEFEETHAKNTNRSFFVNQTEHKTITMSKSQLVISYEHITCGFDEKGSPINFIDRWLYNNNNMNVYDDVGIYPNDALCPKKIYNMWIPFAMERITQYEEKPDELKKILNHIRILCNNEEDVYKYFINWIAQMIQYPEVKTIIPTLISKEGSGKETLLSLLSKMLESEKVMETTSTSRDVWGDFNGIMTNAFLVNLNELSKKETENSEGKIKGLITDSVLYINNKGVNQYPITSYHRFIITASYNNILSVTFMCINWFFFIRCDDKTMI